ncbi:MAG: hypothetical protein ACLT3W_02935 [Bifidobacterium pseudocatenulatum]
MTAGFSPNGTSFGRLCHVCIVRGSGKWGYEKSSDSVLAENRTIFLLRWTKFMFSAAASSAFLMTMGVPQFDMAPQVFVHGGRAGTAFGDGPHHEAL